MSKVYPICVIGGGAAGTMAVLRTILNNDECLFFPGSPQNKKRSRALWVRKIENMPSHLNYKRGIEEPNAETIKWIQQSEFKDKLHLQKNVGVVQLRRTNENIFEITDSKGNVHYSKFVVLCTGIMDVQPTINGSIESIFDYANAQTVDYCLICDGHHTYKKKTSVIGHTNSAAWVAILLYERYEVNGLTIFTNGKKAEFEPDTLNLINLYHIEIVEDEIQGIQSEAKGILKAFVLKNKIIETEICFIALGMLVYNDLAKQVGAELDHRGFVKTNDQGHTSVDGLYVAGDLRANTRKQVYTAWDNAVTAISDINLKLRIEKRSQLLKNH